MEALRVTFVLDRADLPSVAILTEALTQLDALALARNPRTVGLYESGVVFQSEAIGVEEFPTTPIMYERGVGDCAPLAAARTAELRRRGKPRAITIPIETPERPCIWDRTCPREIHILVSHDGTLETLEDPSAILGMRPVSPQILRELAHRAMVQLGRVPLRPSAWR